MDDRRTMTLDLCRGEQRQVLLEAGSMVLVLAGPIKMQVQASYMPQEFVLTDEQLQLIDESAWVTLSARQGGQLVLIPADRISLWQKVGRCLESIFGNLPTGKSERLFGPSANG